MDIFVLKTVTDVAFLERRDLGVPVGSGWNCSSAPLLVERKNCLGQNNLVDTYTFFSPVCEECNSVWFVCLLCISLKNQL